MYLLIQDRLNQAEQLSRPRSNISVFLFRHQEDKELKWTTWL